MDFNSLAVGQPLYVLQKSEKPSLQIGTVKSKTDPKYPYQSATPNLYGGFNTTNVVDVVATINGSDVPFNNLPVNVETTSYNNGNTVVSCSQQSMLQAVDNMIQASKKALEQVTFHKTVLSEGEKMLEALNPRYAEEKKQARTIKSLEERQAATDQKLDSILSILQDLNGSAKK